MLLKIFSELILRFILMTFLSFVNRHIEKLRNLVCRKLYYILIVLFYLRLVLNFFFYILICDLTKLLTIINLIIFYNIL